MKFDPKSQKGGVGCSQNFHFRIQYDLLTHFIMKSLLSTQCKVLQGLCVQKTVWNCSTHLNPTSARSLEQTTSGKEFQFRRGSGKNEMVAAGEHTRRNAMRRGKEGRP